MKVIGYFSRPEYKDGLFSCMKLVGLLSSFRLLAVSAKNSL